MDFFLLIESDLYTDHRGLSIFRLIPCKSGKFLFHICLQPVVAQHEHGLENPSCVGLVQFARLSGLHNPKSKKIKRKIVMTTITIIWIAFTVLFGVRHLSPPKS